MDFGPVGCPCRCRARGPDHCRARPESRDILLLMRYPGDRKQTRREDLARRACLLAIAGDEREDFDELYAYLVNPEAALRLENLIGDGWFLVPPLHSSDQRPTQ